MIEALWRRHCRPGVTGILVTAIKEKRGWRFATFRKNSSLNRSLRYWPTEAAALRAGRREWNVV